MMISILHSRKLAFGVYLYGVSLRFEFITGSNDHNCAVPWCASSWNFLSRRKRGPSVGGSCNQIVLDMCSDFNPRLASSATVD